MSGFAIPLGLSLIRLGLSAELNSAWNIASEEVGLRFKNASTLAIRVISSFPGLCDKCRRRLLVSMINGSRIRRVTNVSGDGCRNTSISRCTGVTILSVVYKSSYGLGCSRMFLWLIWSGVDFDPKVVEQDREIMESVVTMMSLRSDLSKMIRSVFHF